MAIAERSIDSPHLGAASGIGPGAARRTLDVIVSSLALMVLLVPMLLVALAVRTTSRGPALFAQSRIGQGGHRFRLFKFRTMRHGAGGSALTVPGDARVTRIGRLLRASCVDELPQLLNVLAGHMTLVGPRPQTPGLAARYPAHLRGVFEYRPGLTGPGVVRFNDEDVLPPGPHTTEEVEDYYLEHVVPKRVTVDMEFCERPTLRRTLGLLWETAALAPHRFTRRKVPETQKVITLPDVHVTIDLSDERLALAPATETDARSQGMG